MSAESPDLLSLPWRTGRKVGLNVYAQLGGEPSDDDPYIGVMFASKEVAAETCAAHNYRLAIRTNAPAIHPAT